MGKSKVKPKASAGAPRAVKATTTGAHPKTKGSSGKAKSTQQPTTSSSGSSSEDEDKEVGKGTRSEEDEEEEEEASEEEEFIMAKGTAGLTKQVTQLRSTGKEVKRIAKVLHKENDKMRQRASGDWFPYMHGFRKKMPPPGQDDETIGEFLYRNPTVNFFLSSCSAFCLYVLLICIFRVVILSSWQRWMPLKART